MTVPSNRDKNPTQDPDIAGIINSDEPIVEEVKIEDDPANQDPTETPPVEPTPDEPTPEAPTPTPKPEAPDLTDYKEKFKASSQEALALHFKNQKIQETIDEAANLPDPTEDEVREYAKQTGAEYDDLDDLTKTVLKDTLLNKRRFEKINEANKEAKNITDWVAKVDHFTSSPETIVKYPDLLDNAEDFRAFSIKQSRRGMDLDDIATAFLYGQTQTPVKHNKGSMLMPGGNGAAAEPKPEGITEDQAMAIRTSNPKEYRRLVKEGKIKISI